jgi:hypothetical protein
MMDLFSQGILAEVYPVRFSIGEVQMPNLVNRVRRCYTLFTNAAQVNEFFVFLDYPGSVILCPAVFPCNTVRESKFIFRHVKLEVVDFCPEA